MKRSDFLKSILTIIAAPSLIVELGAGIVDAVEPLPPFPSGIRTIKKKIVCMWKINPEMQQDKEGMKFLLEDHENSPFWRDAKRVGIDPKEEFKFYIGFVNDDFIHNVLTIIFSQYQYEVMPLPETKTRHLQI